MSLMPNGWSVDVDVENVVVTFPTGGGVARLELSRYEARVLRFQLRLAYALAGRNVWTAGEFSERSGPESDTFGALVRDRLDLRRVEISEEERAGLWARHRQRVKRYIEQLEHDAARPETATSFDDWENLKAGAQAADGGSAADMGAGLAGLGPAAQVPGGWSIELAGQLIKFVVPASGVDGEFELTDAEALAAGVRLIELSATARWVRVAMEGAGE
ncbi:hypothetical protein JF781_26945 [Mycobacterium sp. WUMAC-067]|uniref:hypothetical protein n=1 Tax=unclassified Mycobacterium TaxID=2642494 RepID=UPI001CD97560|nr:MULTISPECIES: hypothetical protein [unclassified Mycobacterium]MCA2245946.1 hypothetical protein [Mycobacterium sp. WUMAC-067]MCA2317934.1 hypothetical protein [Mycobacterium sp. WUMAC-025]